MILAIGVILFLAIVVVVLFVFFSRGVQGPKSLSGTRCRKCGHRRVMQEVNREFLQGNVKTDFDHYKVIYRCTQCGHQQEQEEHVIPQPK
ncbi:hypothetical protein [uncultured Gimesia sp.]|uniref:hypothetical protein n=1 Tax=uncultured Gimesia sp. TaxID=1678688 RepID=UPI0026120780|nr:hypothetical protein [uncultured Gimesia sp.]